ncbi:50S ribosomal protein L21 [Patescibacteria group bacterium]|nr:50S ribosomal protein L21 [Patescibacteria group bacterium]MBU1721409.1 50S ribosomal protein L21 [Patescibacteria group bacterium]MBU1901849.1 50S ribosomal protein L21 [Patescibacteria group bacterium]
MFAVIETGGKQYLIQDDQFLDIEKLEAEVGTDVVFDKVLLIAEDDGSDVKIGTPYLEGVSITASVTDQKRDKKIRVVKYKRKVRYKRVHGHRQHKTRVDIKKI